jgi:hypothetical protein
MRINDELQDMYRKLDIVTTVEVRSLVWAGHVVRMSDGRTVKIVFVGNQMEEESRKTKIKVVTLY